MSETLRLSWAWRTPKEGKRKIGKIICKKVSHKGSGKAKQKV